MTKLSILVPNYNYGRFLPAYLDSVLTEARGIATEIIISDNCSTDDSVQVIRQYAARHQNIKVITHDRTISFQHNWNACLAAAKGITCILSALTTFWSRAPCAGRSRRMNGCHS